MPSPDARPSIRPSAAHTAIVELAFLPLLVLSMVLPAHAQEPGHDHAHAADSPYADIVDREIKALSDEEVQGLLEGEGMGFALAAELNGVPGPRHVLDHADDLALSSEQERRVQEIFDRMQREAQSLGEELVRRERHLDASFADGSASPESIRRMTGHIADIRGELRAVHLVAHLETADVLESDQVEAYRRLRGYVTR